MLCVGQHCLLHCYDHHWSAAVSSCCCGKQCKRLMGWSWVLKEVYDDGLFGVGLKRQFTSKSKLHMVLLTCSSTLFRCANGCRDFFFFFPDILCLCVIFFFLRRVPFKIFIYLTQYFLKVCLCLFRLLETESFTPYHGLFPSLLPSQHLVLRMEAASLRAGKRDHCNIIYRAQKAEEYIFLYV